ncbi:hypothetical protein PHLCEN_2v612 [Hermanssonia centrifuga]|uniref:Vacuolar sorting protein Vps3844 C-terminal domain-containing protein n=1 Tax=Hermanssonia centrifuga TaxID=98765 RepID=A0A2R6S5J1_9APHY|nr:hypothetical protein PHLCEN_2v612 [Hermanssonia centrifuga]
MKTSHLASSLVYVFSFLNLLQIHAISVYLYPKPSSPVPERLDAGHASLALARHLGLERFEKLGDGDGIWNGALEANGEGWVGTASKDALLITLSEADAKELLPSSFESTFQLSSPPLDSLSPLIQAYLSRAAHTYSTVFSTASSTISQQAAQLLDMFSAPTEANQAFLTSISALVDFLDSQPSEPSVTPGYENFGAFEVNGLQELAKQYGKSSDPYQTAVKTLQAVFTSTISREDTKFAILTFPSPSPSPSPMTRRADPPQSPFPPPPVHPAEPISGVSTCFSSAEVCGNATDGCTGHGECVAASKIGRTCFVCACSASVDDQGRREDWAGTACERKDISGPFVLIGGTVVALVLLVGGSIALLSAIGSQELPSTLTGGVAGGLKRE